MTEAMTFKSWLIQPGHHRELQSLCTQIKTILEKRIVVKSWQDLYGYFEAAVEVEDSHRKIFDPVFTECPPSVENGATERQLKIYRGATPVEIEEPEKNEEMTVTYRGQTIVKKRSENADSNRSETTAKPRYYRGVRIN